MILWPIASALVLVWVVLRDPALDHRMVMGGALVVDLLDAPFGGAAIAHTLVASVALVTVVMLATRGRRLARRRWLALPMGTFGHLIFDGAWADTATFWWPVFGSGFESVLPALGRPPIVLVIQEVVGAAVLAWFWWRFRLSDPGARAAFVRTGRPQLTPPQLPGGR